MKLEVSNLVEGRWDASSNEDNVNGAGGGCNNGEDVEV
jgi:hypothetical protein